MRNQPPDLVRSKSQRVESIDRLRGLVMVLMALDHVREYFGPTLFAPESIGETTPGWFATRWVTHICAPVFVFLAGTSVYLYLSDGRRTRAEASRFLLKRGLWLIVLELVVLNPAWVGSMYPYVGFFLFVQVIWVIGWSMIVLAGLIWLPPAVVALIGAAMVGAHNLFDGVSVPSNPFVMTPAQEVWTVLHVGRTPITIGDLLVAVIYPLVPWPGVMALGYAFGVVARRPQRLRVTWSLVLGVVGTLTFVGLRWWNGYGDPDPWEVSDRGDLFTAMSFLNTEKYPPSLLFLLMTLGPALLILTLLEPRRLPGREVLGVFGRVPLFYYLMHIPLIHMLAIAGALAMSRPVGWWWGPEVGAEFPEGYEPSLPLVYGMWILVTAILYPVCRWYDQFRRHNRGRWKALSYL
ncbi:MAG: DUF1624 domain-containing protein [Phycisphaerales bacterium]